MSSFDRLSNNQDIEDFVRGITFMGTGGGGRPELGIRRLKDVLNDGQPIQWVNVDDIDDEAWTCSVFGMGSIAPSKSDKNIFGLNKKVEVRPNVRVVKELEKIAGVKIEAVVPFELGGNNTSVAVNAAMKLGLKLPDGDYSGRAIPELTQALPVINGLSAVPLAICDEWGNVVHVMETPSNASAEGIGKMISIVTKSADMDALCAHAAFLLRGKDMKKHIVRNTLTRAFRLGYKIRQAREKGIDPIEKVIKETEGKLLFKGKVQKRTYVSENGYMIGDTYIKGVKEFSGQKLKVWYKNENHIAWRDGKVVAMSPDLIEIVDMSSAEPITNTDLKEGNVVAVIGISNPLFRTDLGIKMMGPRYFGFDYEYIPLEELE